MFKLKILSGAHPTQDHEATTTMHVIYFFLFLFIGKIKDIANHGPSQNLWLYDLSLLSCLLVTAIIDFLKNLQLFVIHKVLRRNKKLLKYILIGKCQKHSPRRVLLKWCSLNFHKIHRKTLVPEARNFIKKETLAWGLQLY